ncbi:chitinase-like protein Idgf4 [Toxorhynchites rutilus septentrionalis]|uniref:chitinase-like protein Idgf4 n=1 Tax=Toxorhynchites rutilus septentrionalis TaxID=329112 RepID=UPI00247A3A01|nr:chitinase-like protein Idgf4 [Toxorhynchites rutilus septentrionalis]
MLLKLAGLLLLAAVVYANNSTDGPKVLCYYDGAASLREGLGKVTVADVEVALPFCTHLVYGFAGINPETHKIRSLNEALDLDSGKGQYRQVTSLKKRYPGLKVLLSVGGYQDLTEEKPFEKYLTLLESGQGRTAFVNSVYSLLKTYEFDGLDIAWQFPQSKPKRIRGWTGKLWHGFKKLFTGDSILDPKADEHREEFIALVRDLKTAFMHEKFQIGLTMLPHVNETVFMDVLLLKDSVDYVHLASFNQQTPERNPKEGDFTAPIYEPTDRVVGNNIEAEVKYWLTGGAPSSKLVVGIPTFGRGWKLADDSGITGVPPIRTDGPSPPGPYTGIPGRYSWAEVCAKLPNPGNANGKGAEYPLRKIGDPTKRFGSYAFRIPDENGEHGIWLSYEDPDTAGNKAAYVKAKGLGGISLFDLSNDDFRGSCTGDKFPILRAAKYRL